jgi:transposase
MDIEAVLVAKQPKKRPRLDVNVQQLDELVDKTKGDVLNAEERGTLKTAIHAMAEQIAASYRTTERTESLYDLQRKALREAAAEEKKPKPGHGRNGAIDYTGAERVTITHPSLTSGCPCPDPDCRGKVYSLKEPGPLVRIEAMPPVQATVYELQKLRCNFCEKIYTAPEPADIGPDKYDETVAAMVAVFKYGMAIPFTRLEGMQKLFGVPFPASTQWDLVEEAAEVIKPAYDELVKQAAQGEVVHSDDTGVRILNMVREAGDKRTGTHTSGLVSVLDQGQRSIALYLSGPQHAGENLRDLLRLRAEGLPSPLFMQDALAANKAKLSKEAQEFIANCLAHGRRHVTDQVENFPAECLYVLEEIGKVFVNDKEAREQRMDPHARLRFHQDHSQPVMIKLRQWLTAQMDEKKVEPNSGLGKAFKYLLTHWQRLTLFLRQPGAPIDNNICERALKKAVLHRKNALFYMTLNGAHVGDLFMSLVHTCELNKVNPFDYLTELQRYPIELRAQPSAWMPWNYQTQLARAPSS